jgi:hypothetical protein
LQIEQRSRELALFNLAIDNNLRGCDLVAVRIDDIAPNGYAIERATVRQKQTGRPVRFELTENTRQAVDEHLKSVDRKLGNWCSGEATEQSILTPLVMRVLFSKTLEDCIEGHFGRTNPKCAMASKEQCKLVDENGDSPGVRLRKRGRHVLTK